MDNIAPDLKEIQAILANLQDEIRQHRLALGEMGALEQPDPLAPVRQHQWVNSHLPIGWPKMPPGIIPKVVAIAQKVTRRLLRWYINPLVDQQNAFNAAVTDVLERLHSQSDQQAQMLRDVDMRLKHLQATDIGARLATLEGQTTSLGGICEALQARYAQAEEKYQVQLERMYSAVQEQLGAQVRHLEEILDVQQERQEHENEVARLRLQRLEARHRPMYVTDAPTTPSASSPAFDYFLLGLKYRSEKQIRERLSDYDDLFTQLVRAQREGQGPNGPVLDIGCGRGELVEHLAALGLGSYGIEIDEDAIAIAREQGRDVRRADAFAHLDSLEDDSLAAITMIQVIEHFGVEELLRLLKLAHRKLAPGGLIITETVNPLCLSALSNAYWLDPSHRAVLPPDMTRFLLEQAGFWKIEARFLRPIPAPTALEPVTDLDAEWVAAMNRNIEKLNRALYGPQDYAMIAYKAEE